MTHIAGFSFCGMRRLNQFRYHGPDPFQAWKGAREWYDCASVNVLIGANGAGKSTVLELIDFLRNPGRIVTLARENRTMDSWTFFDVAFGDGASLTGSVMPNRIDDVPAAANIDDAASIFDVQCVSMQVRTGADYRAFARNISKRELDPQSANLMHACFSPLPAIPWYWTAGGRPAAGRVAEELNEARAHLGGILSESELPDDPAVAQGKTANPWRVRDDGRLAVYLSDDSRQSNRLAVDALPAGWLRIASFLIWLKDVPEGAICLVEEPETHLHPHLQRYLAGRIGAIAQQRTLQVFIATHSPVFQQLNVWPHGANVFQAHDAKLSKLNAAWRVLDALGIRASDLSQSNGIIWIEGPSDRMYIKHWLALYCKEHGLRVPLENVEYSFSFYGGASLSHFGVDDTDAFIDMLSINRNFVMVMDRDKDFIVDDFGNLVCPNASLAKARILGSMATRDLKRAYTWLTDDYTIESYLPARIVKQHFVMNEGRLTLKQHHKKVPVATQYIKEYTVFKECTVLLPQLTFHIRRLLEHIGEWNR